MHSVRPDSVCRASNAFQVSRLVHAIFVQPSTASGRRSQFSTSRVARDGSAAQARSEEQDAHDAPLQGHTETSYPVTSGDVAPSSGQDRGSVGNDGAASPPPESAQDINGSTVEAGSVLTAKRSKGERSQQKMRHLINPKSLDETIANFKAVKATKDDPPRVRARTVLVKSDNDLFKRPSELEASQRHFLQKKMYLEELLKKRREERDLLANKDDPLLNKSFLGHLKLDEKEGKANKIAGEKAFLLEHKVKRKAGKEYKQGVNDYEGQYVIPTGKEFIPIRFLPWVKPFNEGKPLYGQDRLDAEIQLFFDYIQATPQEKQIREQVTQETIAWVRSKIPQIDAEVFGSQRTGLSISTSDVDVRIFRREGAAQTETSAVAAVETDNATPQSEAPPETSSLNANPLDASAISSEEALELLKSLGVKDSEDSEELADSLAEALRPVENAASVDMPADSTASESLAEDTAANADSADIAPPSTSEATDITEAPLIQDPTNTLLSNPSTHSSGLTAVLKDSLPEKAPRHKARVEHIGWLKFLHKQMSPKANLSKSAARKSPFMMAQFRHARYPLITCVHRATGIDVQIVCSNDTSKSREIVREYLKEDPDLFPLFCIIKTLHDVRGLLDVYRGGLGSYTLFMMVVAGTRLTQNGEKLIDTSNASNGRGSLGKRLLQYLDFWGNFDTKKYGLALAPTPTLFPKVYPGWKVTKAKQHKMDTDPIAKATATISLIDSVEPYLLCLQDPADPLNDLGAKTFGINHITATYRRLHEQLSLIKKESVPPTRLRSIDLRSSEPEGRKMMVEDEGKGEGVKVLRSYSMIRELVGPAFSAIKERRERMLPVYSEGSVDGSERIKRVRN